ncbi:hypothetical protein HPB48_015160 [Haemaphysalis longicornis]|uniref:Uncharacterized protein n=1 Tax=Haemaphysalis longicornis TaxID=44386 RepID=A0A9J6FIN7_HAELO|nr:hypothetical protein HPB48_015160 [Haemaphysalis longicornis]
MCVGRLSGSYDFILMDPPWENKSAKRKRTYATLRCDQLQSALPLPQLASPSGCLVAVWCTANARNLEFVARELLPSWGLAYLATWYWVKVWRVTGHQILECTACECAGDQIW